MSMWDPIQLAALPLSAYTPGQGDPSVEGGLETASGKPVYTYEAFLRGDAPYVTGATSRKNPSGQLVYRTIGDRQVPVRITDYGPKVEGIDIATTNKKWATNFPWQGSTDKFTPPGMAGPEIGGRPSPIDLGVLGQFATRNYAPAPYQSPAAGAAAPTTVEPGSGLGQLLDAYNAKNATQGAADAAGILGGILGSFGKSMSQQGQQGMQQALQMVMQRRPSAIAALLDQLAANPTMYLQTPGLG